jgi:hypothetical protein
MNYNISIRIVFVDVNFERKAMYYLRPNLEQLQKMKLGLLTLIELRPWNFGVVYFRNVQCDQSLVKYFTFDKISSILELF